MPLTAQPEKPLYPDGAVQVFDTGVNDWFSMAIWLLGAVPVPVPQSYVTTKDEFGAHETWLSQYESYDVVYRVVPDGQLVARETVL